MPKINKEEKQYLRILAELVEKMERTPLKKRQKGPQKEDAVNIGLTIMEFDLSGGNIPLLTTKKVSFKNIAVELIWFLTGKSTLDYLHSQNVHFWDQWATEEISVKYGLKPNDIGRIYGPNWINWPASDGTFINQISWLIKGLKENPQWRRWKVTAWNPEFIDKAFLAPCHGDFHCILVDGKLELHHFQRSGDFFMGVPYDIVSYAILHNMISQVTGLKPGKFVQVTSDTHLYSNHLEAAKEQLRRTPREFPSLELDPKITNIFKFSWPDSFKLTNYNPYPALKVGASL